MPLIFDTLCSTNQKQLTVISSTYPGVSLLQHIAGYADKIKHTTYSDIVMWHRAKAGDTTRNELIHLLTHNTYNYIYLQDRSGDEDSVEYAIKYIKHLAPNARFYIFQNYVYDTRWSHHWDKKRKHVNVVRFKYLASIIDAKILKVGVILQNIHHHYPNDTVYDESGHPTYFGSYIIALLTYKAIYKHPPLNLSPRNALTKEQVFILKRKKLI